jgi:hypothetical protein
MASLFESVFGESGTLTFSFQARAKDKAKAAIRLSTDCRFFSLLAEIVSRWLQCYLA